MRGGALSPFDHPGAWEADLEQVWDLRDRIALLVGRMDTFSERFRASCFNGWQPVDEHRGEDVDHYEAAAAHARRLGASCNADWWQAKACHYRNFPAWTPQKWSRSQVSSRQARRSLSAAPVRLRT